MTVIDRYLHAVGFFLPRAEQDDIIKELSEDIRSQIEEWEAERGRPLNEGEQEQLIKQYGHPALLAGRYGPRRQLIGPEIFPFYRFVLQLALLVGIVVQIAIIAAFLVSGRQGLAIRQLLFLPGVAFVRPVRMHHARVCSGGPLLAFTAIPGSMESQESPRRGGCGAVSMGAATRAARRCDSVGLRLTITTAGVIVVGYLLKAGHLVVVRARPNPLWATTASSQS